MARPQSLYITERTMSALRPGDALSGRINKIVDRYLEMIAADRTEVSEIFAEAELDTLAAAWAGTKGQVVLAMNLQNEMMARLGGHHPAIAERIDELAFGDLVVLIEVLEERLQID